MWSMTHSYISRRLIADFTAVPDIEADNRRILADPRGRPFEKLVLLTPLSIATVAPAMFALPEFETIFTAAHTACPVAKSQIETLRIEPVESRYPASDFSCRCRRGRLLGRRASSPKRGRSRRRSCRRLGRIRGWHRSASRRRGVHGRRQATPLARRRSASWPAAGFAASTRVLGGRGETFESTAKVGRCVCVGRAWVTSISVILGGPSVSGKVPENSALFRSSSESWHGSRCGRRRRGERWR
jgi:hypothetical protein